MHNLYLKNSDELIQISEILNTNIDELKKTISDRLIKCEIELEATVDAGIPFYKIIDDYGFKLQNVTVFVLGRSDNTINNLFGKLKYHHTNDDCTECGCETVTETDGAWGHTWEETKCENVYCDYSESNEPDWDFKRDITNDN